jgi:hypothetical protein
VTERPLTWLGRMRIGPGEGEDNGQVVGRASLGAGGTRGRGGPRARDDDGLTRGER